MSTYVVNLEKVPWTAERKIYAFVGGALLKKGLNSNEYNNVFIQSNFQIGLIFYVSHDGEHK